MKFVHPVLLICLLLVPVIGILWGFLRMRAEVRLGKLNSGKLPSSGMSRFQMPLALVGFALLAIAVARPQWGHSLQTVQARSRNVVIALDVSRSMLAQDVRPNRLERAKADIADLIDSLEGDRCALVAFRRTGVRVCPLTTDRAFLRSALEATTPESAPRGETDLGSAIRTALDALPREADDHNAIILVSDGGDLRGGALQAAGEAQARNVPVFTVGIGNPAKETSVPGPDGKPQQYQGKPVMTRLDATALAAVAKASGGRYVPLATAGTAETTLGSIYRRFLRQVAAQEQAEEEELRATERFAVFLVPGLLALLAAGCLSRGRFRGKRGVALLFVGSLPFFGFADATTAETDGEIWNRGVDAYRAGNMTNALEVLRPLILSKTHGARASELAGAIEFEQRDLESAAEDLQRALRAAPDDPRTNRNYTRAVDRLPEMREAKHVESVLKSLQGQGPDQLLGGAVQDLRVIMREASGALTNAPARALAMSEGFAKRLEMVSDMWIVVKQVVAQAVTNEQQAATIMGDVESARAASKAACEALEDMEPGAADKVAEVEQYADRYLKMVVLPPAALDADILAQTNAFAGVEKINGRDWQKEALTYTAAFRQKFPAWASAYEQQAQADTNKPPFTKEAQDEINALAGEVEKAQLAMCKTPLPPEQLEILKKLERIRELLPKDGQSGGGGQQQNPNPEQNKDDKENQNKDSDKQQPPEQQQPEPKPEEKKEQQPESKKDENDKKDVQALLRKAQERADEHEDEKKAREKSALSPNERDW